MMDDKDEFTFDEEEDEESGFDSEEESEDWDGYETEKKGGSKRLIYLLLLLLVLAGGAGYVLFLSPDDGPSPPVNVVKAPRKPIAAPMPKPAMAKPATVPAQAVKPVTAAASPKADQPKPVAAKPSSVPVPDAPAVVKAKPEPKAVAAVTPKPAPTQVKPKLFESKPTPTPVMAGDYTLSAGAFVMQSSVDGVLKKIRKLGYEAQIQKIKRKIPMTRLLVGVYPAEVAAKKLRQVKKVTSSAFSLNTGSKTAVYAGSYLVLDKARIFADTVLSRNGIRVTEEPAKIERTLQRVTFGAFATRADALKVSREAAGRGLDAKPAKK
jgi:cell division septation protein DedD